MTKNPFDNFDSGGLNIKFSNLNKLSKSDDNHSTTTLANLTNNIDFSNSIDSKSKFNENYLKKTLESIKTTQQQNTHFNSTTPQLINSKYYGSNELVYDPNSNNNFKQSNQQTQLLNNDGKKKSPFLSEILNFKNDRNPIVISSLSNQINNSVKFQIYLL